MVKIGDDGYITKHYANESTRPYIKDGSSIIMNEIMDAAKPISDPQGVTNALKWEVQGKLNGTEGVWELVIDVDKNLVLHFLFNSH